jgi:hypothetical protein
MLCSHPRDLPEPAVTLLTRRFFESAGSLILDCGYLVGLIKFGIGKSEIGE